MISDKKLTTDFSQYFLATLQNTFDQILWADASSTPNDSPIGNMVLSTFPMPNMQPTVSYKNLTPFTDDRNNVDELRVQVMYGDAQTKQEH